MPRRFKVKISLAVSLLVTVGALSVIPTTQGVSDIDYNKMILDRIYDGEYYAFEIDKDATTSLYTIAPKVDEDGDYVDERSFLLMKRRYHDRMNELFNRHITLLVQDIKKQAEQEGLKNYEGSQPPKNLDERECLKENSTNTSTFCLAIDATLEYLAYMHALDSHEDIVSTSIFTTEPKTEAEKEAKEELEDSGLADISQTGTMQEFYLLQQYKIKEVEKERELAKKALDIGLASYDELQFALPVHFLFAREGGVINKLEEYRDQLAWIRTFAQLLPNKFHDASTTDCT